MVTGIPASPVGGTIASINPVVPDTFYTVAPVEAPEGFTRSRAINLVGVTITGTQAPGVGAQGHVGILRSGASAWDGELVSPQVDGGEVFSWKGALRLEEGDRVQLYSSVTAVLDATLEFSSV